MRAATLDASVLVLAELADAAIMIWTPFTVMPDTLVLPAPVTLMVAVGAAVAGRLRSLS